MLARVVSLLLLVLTRDGVLHRLQGDQQTTEPAAGATAMAACDDGRVALLARGCISLVERGRRRAVPGRFADARALACGASLWALVPGAVVRVDARRGTRTTAIALPRARLVAAEGAAVFVEADGVVVEAGAPRRWTVPGHPIALAAGDGKLYVATHEGPLWEIDRATGKERDLGLGDWWGVLGMAAGGRQLFVATVSGKLWRIDPAARTKTIVAMDGWQGAIGLSVLR